MVYFSLSSRLPVFFFRFAGKCPLTVKETRERTNWTILFDHREEKVLSFSFHVLMSSKGLTRSCELRADTGKLLQKRCILSCCKTNVEWDLSLHLTLTFYFTFEFRQSISSKTDTSSEIMRTRNFFGTREYQSKR